MAIYYLLYSGYRLKLISVEIRKDTSNYTYICGTRKEVVNEVATIRCDPPMTGRYVTVRVGPNGTEYLTLCEAEVIATRIGTV